MPRLLALDYGGKRCGIAETDDFKLIASSLATVSTVELDVFLKQYFLKYPVEGLVIGQPFRMSGELSAIEDDIVKFIRRFEKNHPGVKVHRINEAFTSKLAMQAMIQSGAKKKARRTKGNLDKISATIILQQFLETQRNHL